MNTLTRSISLLTLTWVATVAAQPLRPASFERPRLKHQDTPLYPFDLVQTGVREGRVCVAFSVDVAGKVDDSLAIASTRPEFARAAVAAVKRWTFEPARMNGEPIATATEVVFNFEVEGTVVVSMTPDIAVAAWMNKLHQFTESIYPRTLRELDRIPTPKVAPSPAYPKVFAERGQMGEVRVNFYIDENGAVRLPAVETGNDPELAALAINAIQQWRFEPPVAKGQRVLAKTSQVFRFRPEVEGGNSTPPAAQ